MPGQCTDCPHIPNGTRKRQRCCREDPAAELPPLAIVTADPRFDPTKPVLVNGYPFLPAMAA